MAERISPVNLSAILGEDGITGLSGARKPEHVFDDVLGQAISALNGVSETEVTTDKLMNGYIAGKVELSDVMVATAKMTIAVQLAVTAITSAVNTFKEITQMQV